MNATILKLPNSIDVAKYSAGELLVIARINALQKEDKFFIFTDEMMLKTLGIKKSTAHRIIKTLTDNGVIEVKSYFNGFTKIRSVRSRLCSHFKPKNTEENEGINVQKNGQVFNRPWAQIEPYGKLILSSPWKHFEPSVSSNLSLGELNLSLSTLYTSIGSINNRYIYIFDHVRDQKKEKNEKDESKKVKNEIPKNISEIEELFLDYKNRNQQRYPELELLDIHEQAELFFLYWNEQMNWKDSKGNPVKSVALRISTWLKNWRKQANQPNRTNRNIKNGGESEDERFKRLQAELEQGNIFGTSSESHQHEVEASCEVQDIGSSDIGLLGD